MKPPATLNLPAPLFAAAVLLVLALALPEVDGSEVVKVTLELETGKDWEVSVSVIWLPLTQALDVPAAPSTNLTPAHWD